jgi:drug/metabolite transporter (DMT)-like permease
VRAPTQRQAIFELIIAGAIWGYGFIATKLVLVSLGPLAMTVVRFTFSCLVIFPFGFLIPSFRSKKHFQLFKWSIIPGVLLTGIMIFQTWGLQSTSATKSSFITTLYIVLVPVFEVFILRRRLKYEHVFWVFLALVGTALICDFQAEKWNLGDGLTFLCALCAALHIIVLSKISPRIDSPMAFNAYQSLVCAVVSGLIFALFPESVRPFTSISLFGLLFLSIASTAVAFMLQIRAQQVLSASTASLLFLLESPFAAIFGFVFLTEVLSINQWLGATLILVSAVLSVRRQLA